MKVLSVIRRVLERGCGTQLRTLVHSEKYRESAATRRALAATENIETDQAVACKVGHLEMGRHLYYSFEDVAHRRILREGVPPFDRTHPRFTALLQMSGQAIIAKAEEHLPHVVRQLAEVWRSASAERQVKILAQVVCELRLLSESGHDSVFDDILSQTEERVLPGCYGRGEGTPNCVGKAQLAAAFCRLAGIRAYASTPILSHTRGFNFFHGRVAASVCALFRKYGIWLGQPLVDLFQRSFEGHSKTLQAIDWPHLGLVVQLRNGRWVAFDPAGDLKTVFSKPWEIDDATRLCDKYADALPGLSILCVSRNFDLAQRKAARDGFMNGGMAALSVWDQLGPLVQSGRLSDSELFCDVPDKYEQSGALNFFKFVTATEGARPFVEQEQLCGRARALMFDRARVDSFRFAEAFANGDTVFITEAMQKVRETYWSLSSHLMSIHLTELFNRFSKATRGEPYVACEISGLDYSVALATIAHVGYFMGLEEETEAALSRVSFNQFRLLYSATAAKRRGEAVGTMRERRAEAVFRKLPVRLLTGNRALGIKDWELPMEGGDADATESNEGATEEGRRAAGEERPSRGESCAP